MLNNDAVVTFAYNQKSHQPNDKEGIGQDTIESGERYEKGYEPNNQVYIEQQIPKPFAVVEQKGWLRGERIFEDVLMYNGITTHFWPMLEGNEKSVDV